MHFSPDTYEPQGDDPFLGSMFHPSYNDLMELPLEDFQNPSDGRAINMGNSGDMTYSGDTAYSGTHTSGVWTDTQTHTNTASYRAPDGRAINNKGNSGDMGHSGSHSSGGDNSTVLRQLKTCASCYQPVAGLMANHTRRECRFAVGCNANGKTLAHVYKSITGVAVVGTAPKVAAFALHDPRVNWADFTRLVKREHYAQDYQRQKLAQQNKENVL